MLHILWAGVFWGVTTLVRPVTLILPVFVFFVFYIFFQKSWPRILLASLVFTLGMGLVICPYTARNYALTKRIIPVNSQAGFVFWAATVPQPMPSSNHFNWWELWAKEGMPLFTEVTGENEYSRKLFMEQVITLEQKFKRKAIDNLNNHPGYFFINAWFKFLAFNTKINSVFIKIFQWLQNPGQLMVLDRSYFVPGAIQDFYNIKISEGFERLILFLTLMSFLGGVMALRKKDKNPFLFLFSAYFIHTMFQYRSEALIGRCVKAGAWGVMTILVSVETWFVWHVLSKM